MCNVLPWILIFHQPLISFTYNLKLGNVLFPPNIFLVLWIPNGDEIITVHHSMDQTIDHTEQNTLTTWGKKKI